MSKKPEKEKHKRSSFFTIRSKLMLIISTVVLSSLGILTFLALSIFEEDMTRMVTYVNSRTSKLLGEKVETEINARLHIFKTADQIYLKNSDDKENAARIIENGFYSPTSGILYTAAYRYSENTEEEFLYEFKNSTLLATYAIHPDALKQYINSQKELIERPARGETIIFNSSPYFNYGIWVVGYPVVDEFNLLQHVMVSFLTIDELASVFIDKDEENKDSLYTSFMVDSAGQILVHPDSQRVIAAASVSDHPVVEKMYSSQTNNGIYRFAEKQSTIENTQKLRETKNTEATEEKVIRKIGAYRRLAIGNLGVVTTVPEEKALESVYIVRYRSLLITGIILLSAVLFVFFFAKTISTPIKELALVSEKVKEGDYEIEIKPRTKDEVGDLTRSFNQMVKGLAEREKLKGALGKFVNEEIANMAMSGDLGLGGERKQATVFFSDIRSFTAISENMQPEQVVEFLNEYFTLMVDIIHKKKGVVDKFIGDAIMALWGVPKTTGNDAVACIDAALEMRQAMIAFNRDRGRPGRPVIRIGCGINSGPVLAGQIGSEDRLEYSVIGDTVNLASRIEALNKPMGTDILISSFTYDLVKNQYKTTPMQRIKVKGKESAQQIYAVLGKVSDPRCYANLEDLRRELNIPEPEQKEISLEEEKKYEIIEE